ncbi:MAG: TolC family protein [Deltaproteobacteria bacterium]|nr:TolC family protein [Deltaproteobacteria bacterium]
MKISIRLLPLLASGALFVCCSPVAFAKPTSTVKKETLESLTQRALDNNPELELYSAEIAAAKGQYISAGTWSNPQLSSNFGNKRISGDGPATNGFAFGVSIMQTFEWPGRIELREAIARKQILSAESSLSQFKSELARKTRNSGFKLMIAQESVRAAAEVSKTLKSLREVLSQRDPAGVTPLIEIRILEATELMTERKIAEAQLAAQGALFDINQMLGESSAHEIRMQDERLDFKKLPDVQTLIRASQDNNFDVKSKELDAQQQSLQVSLEENNRHPAVAVGPYVTREASGDREVQVGLGITLPLQLWDNNTGNIVTARAKAQKAEHGLRLAQKSSERDVLQNALVYQQKLEQINKWRGESFSQFEKANQLADEHYRNGAVPVATYVELKKQYLDALQAYSESQIDALEAAQNLERLTGLQLSSSSVVSSTKSKR